MRAMLLALGCLCGYAGCIDIPGLAAGDPCNPKGVCLEGLVCVQGTCLEPGAAGTWEEMSTAAVMTYYGLWGTSANDLYAVGSEGVTHFDGSQWRKVTEVASGSYRAVWGNAGTVYVAGSNKSYAKSSGGSWTPFPLMQPDGTTEIKSYTIKAMRGGYAIESNGTTSYRLLQLTSSNWREVYARQGDLGGEDLLVSGGKVYFVGTNSRFVGVYQGGNVDQLTLPGSSTINLYGIFQPPGADVVVAGSKAVLARSGSQWQALPADQERGAHAIWGTGSASYFVVGDAAYLNAANRSSTIEACNAQTCTFEQLPKGVSIKALKAVWGDGRGFVVAAGEQVILRRK